MACLSCARLGAAAVRDCVHDAPDDAAARIRAKLDRVAPEISGEMTRVADEAEARDCARKRRRRATVKDQ